MTHAVFSPLFSEIKRARERERAEADGKVAEVEGWLGRKGWQQRSLKMCWFSVTWRRPCHSSFFCLITHLSLRYTARRQGCWQDCDTDRKRKRRKEIVCSEQFNLTHSVQSNSIHLLIFYACLFLFRVTDNSIQFNSFLSFCFPLCLSEHSHLTTALPISSTRHSLTTSTPHSAGPTGTHTNSVCLSSLDGHGIGKRDG